MRIGPSKELHEPNPWIDYSFEKEGLHFFPPSPSAGVDFATQSRNVFFFGAAVDWVGSCAILLVLRWDSYKCSSHV